MLNVFNCSAHKNSKCKSNCILFLWCEICCQFPNFSNLVKNFVIYTFTVRFVVTISGLIEKYFSNRTSVEKFHYKIQKLY